jgi:hypothetical protein
MKKGEKMSEILKKKISQSHLNKYENGFIHPSLGKPKSLEHRINISKAKIGAKNPAWKEENTYRGYHRWVHRKFGEPKGCEHCDINDNRMYHWAAKNHKNGDRNREDWLRLCVPCHSKYDGITGCKRTFTAEHKVRMSESKKKYWSLQRDKFMSE